VGVIGLHSTHASRIGAVLRSERQRALSRLEPLRIRAARDLAAFSTKAFGLACPVSSKTDATRAITPQLDALQARLAGFDTSRFEIGKNFKGA
jgi:hypothetical protein